MATPHSGPDSVIQREIQQTRPFHSIGAEAVLGILRTASLIERRLNTIVAREGISQQQYNVLRILRGAGVGGVRTLAIRDRMVDVSPGVTRLIDRLEKAGHARRGRSSSDRRHVMCHITPQGLALLARLDAPVRAYDDAAVEMLTDHETREFVRVMDRIRSGNE